MQAEKRENMKFIAVMFQKIVDLVVCIFYCDAINKIILLIWGKKRVI